MNYKECNFIIKEEYGDREFCNLKSVDNNSLCNGNKCIFIRDKEVNITFGEREVLAEKEIKKLVEKIIDGILNTPIKKDRFSS